MTTGSFEAIKQRIKDGNDLVALIESYIPLQRRGRTLVALCPFHQEKSPSFTVWPDSQHYKCFGCQKAGDVFTFLMEREGLTFREACERLAERAGIPIDGMFGGPREVRTGPDPAAVLDRVRRFFADCLRGEDGRAAREYLHRRGLDGAVLPFGLGWHPERHGQLLAFARREQLPLAILEQAGLVRDGRSEPFHGRVMFPIVDERGRVVAFGGRVLGDEKPKYINSPESPFFNKRKVLFGLDQVKRAGTRRVVVMEGYTDAIACHLAGFTGAVATLGTALTTDHATKLLRYASGPGGGVVLLFDGDEAGRRAADRAFRELAGSGLETRIALLPEGIDPADQVAPRPGLTEEQVEAGKAALAACIDRAEDAMAVWFRLLRQRHDWVREGQVEPALADCASVLASVRAPAQRQVMLGRMAGFLGLPADLLVAALRKRAARPAGASATPAAGAPAPGPASDPRREAEIEVLGALLLRPDLAGSVPAGLLRDPGIAELVARLGELAAAGELHPDAVLSGLFTRAADRPELGQVVGEAHARGLASRDAETSLRVALRGLRLAFRRDQAQKTRLELQQAQAEGDPARVRELTERYLALLREA